jgi:pilus assembly protein CpaE
LVDFFLVDSRWGFMMTIDPVVAIVAVGVGLALLIFAVGAFWIWRRRVGRKEAAKKTARRKAKKPAAKSKKAGQSAPTAPAVEAAPAPTPAPPPGTGSAVYELEEGEKIRILIVDDNPDTRGHVSRLLYFENDLSVIGQAINGREGVEMAVEFKPHIVLMDINMPDMDGITATRELSSKAPFSQVIIMSVQAEQHYMKQAMAAGARDFQPKPFTSDELINCVRRVYNIGLPMYRQFEAVQQTAAEAAAQSPPEAGSEGGDAPVIVIFGPKGGVGTSTVAANLAIALQRLHGDVVLMDADLQFGDVLVHLNIRPTRTMSDLIHNRELDIELLPDVLLSHNSGLKLLLAPPQPELADALTPEMLSELVTGLKRDFKAVLVDTQSKLGDKMMAIVEKADYIILVTVPELPAIKSAKQFLDLATLLEFGPNRVGVLINRANQPGGVAPGKIERILKLEYSYRIPYDPRITLAINRGVAVTQQEPNAPSAQAIAQIAKEVWQTVSKPRPVKGKENVQAEKV